MGKPQRHWKQHYIVSQNMDDYRTRLTPEWVAAMDNKAAKATPQLIRIVADFLIAIRAAEVAASMPYNAIAQLQGFVDNYTRRNYLEPGAKMAAMTITRILVRELDIKDAELRHRIAVKCMEIGGRMHEAGNVQPEFSLEDVWRQYYDDPGFRLALWDSQRLGFVSAYNAYDIFLIRCIKGALKRQHFRRGSDEEFEAAIATHFGDATCDVCWRNTKLQDIRHARNAITHAGGRIADVRGGRNTPYQVVDGVIQILPSDLAASLRAIECAADALLDAAIQHSSFQHHSRNPC